MDAAAGAGVLPRPLIYVAKRLSWLLLFGLAACSPYSFSQEVGDFSAGVDQLSIGFTRGFSALAADRAAKTQLELTGSRARVHVASACLDPGKPRTAPCELHALGTPAPTLSEVEQLRGETMSAVAALRNYAHALAAVTNAADRAAYDAAVAQLSGSVGALAKNADAAAPGASIVAPAAVNLAGLVVGTALDQQRFESLKAGVTAAGTAPAGGDSPVATVAKTLGGGLVALSLARQTVLIDEAKILEGRLDPSLSDTDYQQRLSNAQAVVAVLDSLRQADPTAATDALVRAHDALLAAVHDPRRNYASLLQAVSDFADQAAALQAALAAAAELEKAADRKES
jgi:hypothetical protein